ncbi:MAG: HAMP domain-containing protein [Anaerolineales bacterium]|nr:HAMP domain-containing protein [Anaerolineales bacterium]
MRRASLRIQNYWQKMSLQAKISGLMSLLVLATVLALTFLSIQRERANFQKELLEQANLLLDTTSLTLRDSLYNLQLDELSDVAKVVGSNPDVTVFIVYDQKGKVLVDSSQANLGFSQTPDPLGEKLLKLKANDEYSEWQDGQLLAGRSVILGNRPIGAVVTGLSTEPLNQKIRTITFQGILLGLITLSIGGALTFLLTRQIINPLSAVANAAVKMSEGNFSMRVAETSKDEIGRLARAFNEMATGLQEREWLKDLFGRFVSQEVADAIRNGQVVLEGENRLVSVLFCDIREFTDFSERHTPQEVVKLLNEFLPLVVQAAQKHNGMVNKFGGDSTLIIYGAPHEVKDNAFKAVSTALEIRTAVRQLNVSLAERGETLRVGVGINTGFALAGAVGPMERQEYTVVGNTVNLAARIDGLNKQFPEHDILISPWTYDALGDHREKFKLISLGSVQIRGRNEPVEIWAVQGKV